MLSRKQLLQRKKLKKRSLQLQYTPQAGYRRQFAMLQNLQQLKWIKGKRVLMRRMSNLEGIIGEGNETMTKISKNALKTMTKKQMIQKIVKKLNKHKRCHKKNHLLKKNQKSQLLQQLMKVKLKSPKLQQNRIQTSRLTNQTKKKRRKKSNQSEEPSTQRKTPRAGAVLILVPSF